MEAAITLFKEFLRKQRAFRKYSKACKELKNLSFRERLDRFDSNRVTPEDFLIVSFAWSKTEQGPDYWNELDKLWRQYVKAQKGEI